MIKVAGVWERGWTTPIMEFDLWAFPLRDFEVDEFIMCPVSGIKKAVTEYENIEQVIKANPKLTPVFVSEDGEKELAEFKHPRNALYILGCVSYTPAPGKAKSVRVATAKNMGLLWPHQAICIVLRDRWLSL